MTKLPTRLIVASAMLFVAACGGTNDSDTSNEADEFAARINSGGSQPAASGSQAPQVAQTLPGAAPGPYVPGTSTDPQAVICSAPAVGPFFGRQADQATRDELIAALRPGQEVRFISPGAPFINPDPNSTRLNIMIDVTGVIRDARCG